MKRIAIAARLAADKALLRRPGAGAHSLSRFGGRGHGHRGPPPRAKLTDILGQQVIVDNRVGASGVIGTEFAARSVRDGTALHGNAGNLASTRADSRRCRSTLARFRSGHAGRRGAFRWMVAHPSLLRATSRA